MHEFSPNATATDLALGAGHLLWNANQHNTVYECTYLIYSLKWFVTSISCWGMYLNIVAQLLHLDNKYGTNVRVQLSKMELFFRLSYRYINLNTKQMALICTLFSRWWMYWFDLITSRRAKSGQQVPIRVQVEAWQLSGDHIQRMVPCTYQPQQWRATTWSPLFTASTRCESRASTTHLMVRNNAWVCFYHSRYCICLLCLIFYKLLPLVFLFKFGM